MRRDGNSDPFSIYGSPKFRDYNVKSNSKKRWFEVGSVSNNNRKDSSNSEPVDFGIEKNVINFWLTAILFGILVLFVRTAYLQLFQGDHFQAVAEGNRIRILDIKAIRGVVYDRHQDLLVENVPSFSLAVVMVDLLKEEVNLPEVSTELAKISQQTAEEILNILESQSAYSYQPVTLQENLTHDQAILTKILSSRYPGVILKVDSSRHYLTTKEQPSLSHILGYLGKIEEDKLEEYMESGYSFDDYAGKVGLEIFYETQLKGTNGREQVEVDAMGDAKEVIASQKPISGQNLVLTIDSELQKVAEESLSRILGSYGKAKGSVIVLDPNSGEILAMVSLPAFDSNQFSQGISQEEFSLLINNPNQPLFARAISGEYPSGSIFKLIVGVAALEENLVNSSKSFYSSGGIAVSSWFFPDWKAGGHGWTNMVKAIAESVNTYFYTIGGGYEEFVGLGVARIKDYAQRFGLNQKLGIDLPNEADGFLPSKEWKERVKDERWYIGDTYHLAIGQGDILVTPLQVAAYTSVFANGGILYKPYLVKEVLDKDNNIVTEISPQILNENFIDQVNIDIINKGLRQGVLSGSSKALYNLSTTVAAKTGTAQWSSKNDPHAWLTAFAPYDNPQIVVTVLVEEGEEGSRTAVPVAYDIINWWATNR